MLGSHALEVDLLAVLMRGSLAPLAGYAGVAGGLGQPAQAAERPKGTTDTARRILATLESLDQAVAKGDAGAAVGLTQQQYPQQQQEPPAASAPPPPTDSLGFAGAGGWEREGRGCSLQSCTVV